ncbi:hypothetical protein MVEN_01212300 [Mycena venus]|uniref:Uncharacterized protein n=1 Tax=Mycena venus TaxID=2733690 RepID=A0A8H6Y5X9_9AGAR|nr:hypothetical protein MVEN_01212300 [Mycena venus]
MHPPLDLPLLRKFSIRFFPKEWEEHDPLVMFNNVPPLHEVLIGEVLPSLVSLPWQQITKFTGACYTVSECLQALRLMSNHVEWAFSAYELDDEADGLKVFSHSNMQHLTLLDIPLNFGNRDYSAHILRFLTLPALRLLEIQGVVDLEPLLLREFLLRPSPPVIKTPRAPI